MKYLSLKMDKVSSESVAIIAANSDNEILWAGGAILTHPFWNCFIVRLCRKNDEDRATKIYKVLKILNATGNMGDLDEKPRQKPLSNDEVELSILDLLPQTYFDLIITHNTKGEYTRHLRHEETSKAVISLWHDGKISTSQFWFFAHEDGNKASLVVIRILLSLTIKMTQKYWQFWNLWGFLPTN